MIIHQNRKVNCVASMVTSAFGAFLCSPDLRFLLLLLLLLLIVITFMQGIYLKKPMFLGYNIAATHYLQFMSQVTLFSMLNVLYSYYVNTFRSVCDSLQAGRSGNRIPVEGTIFPTSPERPWDPPASCTMGTGSSPEVRRPLCGVNNPPASSGYVKERVKLYLYSPCGLHGLC
jgi:hypothetical protein